MTAPIAHRIKENTFWLSPDRVIYWEEQKILLVSDLHFGKTGHFRKSGIAVPQSLFKEDLQRFMNLVTFFKPDQVIAVGDLFHSHANKELDLFLKWRNDVAELDLLLVRGNHDILKSSWYEAAHINVAEGQHTHANFCFVHDPAESNCEAGYHYTFSGHLHPAVLIRGIGRQSLRFPCFYFGAQQGILPAFSKFSGVALVEPRKTATIFAIADDNIISL